MKTIQTNIRRGIRLKQLLAWVLTCWTAWTGMAQEKKQLTLEDLIPGGSTFAQYRPQNCYGLQWWGDVCIRPDVDSLFAVSPTTGRETLLATLGQVNEALRTAVAPGAERGPLFHFYYVSFPWPDQTRMLIALPGKYVVYDWEARACTDSVVMRPKAAHADYCKETGRVAYTVGNNLYVDNRAVTDEPEGVVCGQAVHRNEFGITKGTFWSPKGQALAFYRMDEREVTDYPLVDVSARVAELTPIKYPMAGMTSHRVTVGIYRPDNRQTVYLDAGDPTDRYFTNLTWSPDERHLYVVELNRDQNHAQLVRYDAQTGARLEVLYEEWADRYVEPLHPLLFVPGQPDRFLYQSQRDGYNHLYLMDLSRRQEPQTKEGGLPGMRYAESLHTEALTAGDWLVQDVLGFDAKARNLYYLSTEPSALESHLYRLDLRSRKRTRLTPAEGVHGATLSPSGRYVVDSYSSACVPRVVRLAETKQGKTLHTLLTAPDPYEGCAMPTIEVGTLKAADGQTDLYYRLVKPSDFDPQKKYPAIVYVYGGPHAQMIHNNFLWDARGWDLYMAQQGYLMFTLDNRGSDNRGLAFEQATFRRLGIEEGKDQVKGVEFLRSLPYVDADRIGVHGWSFGGHMTTALMLRYPDLFKVGVAGGPVIDWSFYEVMYGERYMDTPQSNPEGYERTDLRRLAGALQGHLLLIHDDEDHTCVLQHTLSFIQACVEARTYPDLFIYPGHDHNVRGRDRVHLHEKITRYFKDYLK